MTRLFSLGHLTLSIVLIAWKFTIESTAYLDVLIANFRLWESDVFFSIGIICLIIAIFGFIDNNKRNTFLKILSVVGFVLILFSVLFVHRLYVLNDCGYQIFNDDLIVFLIVLLAGVIFTFVSFWKVKIEKPKEDLLDEKDRV